MIEGDEYDCAFFDKRPKFVHYLPNVAIVGNVEFDHADIYPDLAAVQLAFVRLLNVVPRNGLLIAGTESPALVEILPKARCRVETFGLHEGADWRATEVRTGSEGSCFRLARHGRDEGEFTLRMGGEHNVRNALAALAAAAEAGVEPGGRPGVARRLPGRQAPPGGARRGGGRHGLRRLRPPPDRRRRHPGRPARPGGKGRLVAVFEPRSFTAKTRAFQDGFARAFAGADRVIIAAAHLPGKVPEAQRLSEAGLVDGIRREGGDAVFIPAVDEIVRALADGLRPGDRVADPLERGVRRHPRQTAPSPRSRRSPLTPAVDQTLWNRRGVHAITSRHTPYRFACCTASRRCRPRRGAGGTGHTRGGLMKREWLACMGLVLLTAGPLLAQQAGEAAGQKPEEKAKAEEEAVRRSEEVTVESASKVAGKLIDAPATMSVVTSETLAAQPAQNMADTLRSVRG